MNWDFLFLVMVEKARLSDVQEKLRLDKYLWSIRLFKTRTLAAAAWRITHPAFIKPQRS
jgi:hypothetical protein